MKSKSLLSVFLIFFLLPAFLSAKVIVKHYAISSTHTDVTNPTVVGEIKISPRVAGKVIVHFDGNCVSTPGDRIVLAASDTTMWHINDGAVSVIAKSPELKKIHSLTQGCTTLMQAPTLFMQLHKIMLKPTATVLLLFMET